MSLITNASAQTALATLRGVNSNLQETQDRISTGLKVRSPNENPAFFLVAQTVRGDLAVLNGLKDNLTIGVNAAKVAGSGLQSMTDQINTIQASLTSAESGTALNEIQFAIEEVIGQIEGQVDGTNFNGTNLLKGVDTTTVTTTVIREAGSFKLQTFTLSSQNLDNLELAGEATAIYTAAEAQQQFDDLYRAFNPGLADRFDTNGDGSVNLAAGGGDDLGLVAGEFSFQGSQEDADFLTSLGITVTNQGNIDPSDPGATIFSFDPAENVSAGGGARQPQDFEASALAVAQVEFATADDLLQRAVFSDQNLKQFADASGFRAVARQIEVAEVGQRNVSAGFVLADSLIGRVNIAQTVIGVFESTLSSRQDFLENLTDSLELGVAALVEADLEEESSRLQSLQVQQQLATQSLQIANQRPQNILSLFR